MQRIYILILFISFTFNAHSQFVDDFSDNNLDSNPTWAGDLANFIINTDQELQLAAADGGTSQLYTQVVFPDSIEWNILVYLDFSPSGSNLFRLDLMMDNPDLDLASGYYLEVGESGSADAFKFFRQENGNSTLLGEASMASFAASTNIARIKVIRDASGFWNIAMDYSGGTAFETEIELVDDIVQIENGYFSLYCKYTGSRADKFRFDDISVGDILQDETAPQLTKLEIIDNGNIKLFFDEELDENSAMDLTNFTVDRNIGNPESAIYSQNENCVSLKLNPLLNSGLEYQITIDGISDKVGNIYFGTENFFLLEAPEVGDLLINEILSDPLTGGSDYVEIYNSSEKIISLKDVLLSNEDRENDTEFLQEDLSIQPNSYMLFTENTEQLIENYQPENNLSIVENDLPAFNQSDGNVSLIYNGVVLDAFDYDESFHFELLDDTKGVALERISFSAPTNEPSNWTSAIASTNFGTPGYKNANSLVFEDVLEDKINIPNPIFSPNGDGSDDQLIIRYITAQNGFLLNAKVFDIQGREIADLYKNEVLGLEGFLTWNGLNADRQLADLGAYVLWFELFDVEGNVEYFKKPVVLADFLD